MNFSYWEQKTYFSGIDVAIIGSGIVGLIAAYHLKLKEPHLKVIIFERNVLPNGSSSKDEGSLSLGNATDLINELKQNGDGALKDEIVKKWKGVSKLKEILGPDAMGYEEGGYELFESAEGFEGVNEHINIINELIKSATGGKHEAFTNQSEKIKEFGFQKVQGLLYNFFEGKVDTGKLMQALVQKVRNAGVEILNGIKALSLQPTENGVYLVLEGGFILKVKKVLVATNGFAKELLPELNLSPLRKQIVATSPIAHLKFDSIFHYQHYTFRNIDSRVLIADSHNEETPDFGFTENIQNKLFEVIREVVLPQKTFTIDYRWNSISGFGPEDGPIVKKVVGNIYCAVKTHENNLSLGSTIGEEAAELVRGDL